MDIDITGTPPADLKQAKKKLLHIIFSLLGLILIAVLLGTARIVLDTGHDTILENAALILFVGAGFVFVYFAEKLQAHKPLTAEQKGKIDELGRQFPEVAAYCFKVAAKDRNLILAEYEALTAHVDKVKGEKN